MAGVGDLGVWESRLQAWSSAIPESSATPWGVSAAAATRKPWSPGFVLMR